MSDPVNYTGFLKPIDPSAVTAGITQAQSVVNNSQQMAQAAAAARAKASYTAQLQAASAKAHSPTATSADWINYSDLMAQSNPDAAKQIQDGFAKLSSEKQQQTLSQAGQVISAYKNGHPELAEQILDTQAQGYENAGQTDKANYTRSLIRMSQNDPGAVQAILTGTTAFLPGGDTVLKGVLDQSTANKTDQELPYNIQNIQADTILKLAEAGRTKAVPPEILKDLNATVDNANQSYALSAQHDALADKLDTVKIPPGLTGKALQSALSAAGISYGTWGATQNEYNRLKAQGGLAVAQELKGSLSDKDVVFALSGWPGDDASPTDRASFLRGMAKLERYNAAVGNSKVQWQSENGGSEGTARSDFQVNGIDVPKGTTLNDFLKKNVPIQLPLGGEVVNGQQVGSKTSSPSTAPTNVPAAPGAISSTPAKTATTGVPVIVKSPKSGKSYSFPDQATADKAIAAAKAAGLW